MMYQLLVVVALVIEQVVRLLRVHAVQVVGIIVKMRRIGVRRNRVVLRVCNGNFKNFILGTIRQFRSEF